MSSASSPSVEASHERQSGQDAAILTATSLRKAFGHQLVIRDLSLSFNRGELVLILGSNGAGKSTLLRMLAGLTRPDGGTVSLKEGRLGFASHYPLLYSKLTVRENLSLILRVLDVCSASVDNTLAEWSLVEVSDKQLGELSKGYQARVSLARACMGSPKALILDEPSSNLDHQATQFLRDKIAQVAQDGLVIVATHDVHRLGDLASRVVVLERGGRVVDSGAAAPRASIESLIQRYQEVNR